MKVPASAPSSAEGRPGISPPGLVSSNIWDPIACVRAVLLGSDYFFLNGPNQWGVGPVYSPLGVQAVGTPTRPHWKPPKVETPPLKPDSSLAIQVVPALAMEPVQSVKEQFFVVPEKLHHTQAKKMVSEDELSRMGRSHHPSFIILSDQHRVSFTVFARVVTLKPVPIEAVYSQLDFCRVEFVGGLDSQTFIVKFPDVETTKAAVAIWKDTYIRHTRMQMFPEPEWTIGKLLSLKLYPTKAEDDLVLLESQSDTELTLFFANPVSKFPGIQRRLVHRLRTGIAQLVVDRLSAELSRELYELVQGEIATHQLASGGQNSLPQFSIDHSKHLSRRKPCTPLPPFVPLFSEAPEPTEMEHFANVFNIHRYEEDDGHFADHVLMLSEVRNPPDVSSEAESEVEVPVRRKRSSGRPPMSRGASEMELEIAQVVKEQPLFVISDTVQISEEDRAEELGYARRVLLDYGYTLVGAQEILNRFLSTEDVKSKRTPLFEGQHVERNGDEGLGVYRSCVPDEVEITDLPLSVSSSERASRFRLMSQAERRGLDGRYAHSRIHHLAAYTDDDSPELVMAPTDVADRRQSSRSRRLAKRRTGATDAHSEDLVLRGAKLNLGRSRIHAWGLFAIEPIEPNQFVIEYTGEVIRPVLADVREHRYEERGMHSTYLFRVGLDKVVDATLAGNIARYVNHSCEPNCYAQLLSRGGETHICLYAKRHIRCGEEVTYDYHLPTEDKKHRIPCQCGSEKCRKWLNWEPEKRSSGSGSEDE